MTIRVEFADSPSTELFVPGVVFRTNCDSHGADFGIPCFSFGALTSTNEISGICNHRAIKAGVNGPIRDASLRQNPRTPRTSER